MAEEQLEFDYNQVNEMSLSTEISAKFIYQAQPTKDQQMSLDALNAHTEEVCEILQPVFRVLIINMLELKRDAANGGE